MVSGGEQWGVSVQKDTAERVLFTLLKQKRWREELPTLQIQSSGKTSVTSGTISVMLA